MSFTSHLDCPICGRSEKEIPFYGFSYCNHPICGVCAIKLQKFSKDDRKSDYDYSKCVICKQDISKIIIASNIKQYEDFDESKLLCDNKYSLLFESNSAQKFYNNIMQIVCPQCKTVHDSMEELMEHVAVHKKRYCELCMEFNKCLHFELDTYTDNDYHNHRTKKHPKCKFCEIRFYDDSHLIKHVKDKHFVCDICHRNQGYNAYSTQIELLKHYIKDHFVCEICRASNNINVFESEYNLKTHKVSAHNLSLVGEGLVSVGFGDRDNMRYGARRRARDQDDGFFVEPTTIEIPQTIPTMNCEQEFPRLGGGIEVPAVPVNQQLGTQSLNMDENDTRTAFSSHCQSAASQNDDKLFKKPAVPVSHAPMFHSNKSEKMSDNFAISVKKSAGVLHSEDFPSLSPNGGHPERSYRSGAAGGGLDVSRAVKSTKSSQSPRNTTPFVAPQNNEADFPALPGGTGRKVQHHGGGAPQNGSMWRAAATSKPATRTVTKVNNNKEKHEKNSAGATERKSQEENETNESTIEPPEQRSKVSLVSQEEFQLTAGKQSTTNNRYQHQSVPDERDFPSLGRPPSSSASSSGAGANSSNWAVKSNLSNTPGNTLNKSSMPSNHYDPFAIDSKSDFPGLPVSSQPRFVGGAAGGKKKTGKSGFASVASSSVSVPVTTNKPPSNSISNSNKSAPAPSKMESHAPKQPASLRGIDYIPSVAPTKDPLVVVDSKQFSIMKQAGEHQFSSSSLSTAGGAQFSISNDFPPMQSPPPSNSNHFDALSINDTDDVPIINSNKNNKINSKENAKIAPKLTSESDFPSLGAPKSKQQKGTKKPQVVPKWQPIEKQSQLQPQPQQNAPAVVVSLMDVAMSVAKKQYFSFPDNNERNQSMCESLYDNLNSDMATQFLQLSNLYRNRKLSVQDYLNSLQSDFVENLDFISRMLPQMCALLPDIPLQRSLMSNMPKSWSKDLRECIKCDQVLLTSDVTIHNQLAH